MSGYLIDKVEDIAQRLKELEADKEVARTGSSAPVKQTEETRDVESVYGYGGMCGLGSLAHPGWPYAGTAHEWRSFVNRD